MGPFKKHVQGHSKSIYALKGVGGTSKVHENGKGESGLQSLPRKNSVCTVICTCGKIYACDVV